jgi:hypothetical protein
MEEPPMTEPTPEPEVPEIPAVETQADPEVKTGEPSADLGDAGQKALAAERKARKISDRAAADALAKIKEYEDRDKSDLEKATETAKSAAEERDAAKAEALRLRIAIKHGISDEDAELFLTASDEDTLTRQAEKLSERFAAGGPKSPKPDLSQGARGPVGIDARIAEAQKNGDVKTAISLKSQQLLKK